MNKRVIFWLAISFLVLIDTGLILYQFVYRQPKADVNPTPNPISTDQFNLLPQNSPNINAPLIEFKNSQDIYTLDENYFYSSPVLFERDSDNLLFLTRGKASVKYDEIVYAKSFDLEKWQDEISIKKFTNEKLIDLSGTKTDQGFYLFYITQNADNKYETNYLFSQSGTDWEEKTLNINTDGLIKIAATQDKGSLRVIFLNSDQKTIKQSFLLQNKTWTSLTDVIKLNLSVSDIDIFKKTDYFYLLFSNSNVLYETGSLDFHTFNEPTNIVNLKDNNFNLSTAGVVILTNNNVFLYPF